jgi:hypothetical protein
MAKEAKYRTIVINVRLTEDEAAMVKKKAFQAGLQPAVYIRECSLKKEMTAPISQESMKEIRTLNSMASNLNQVVKAMHQLGLERSASEVDKMLNQIKQLLP